MSSKALSSSVYTKRTSSLPLVACSWSHEASISLCTRYCPCALTICVHNAGNMYYIQNICDRDAKLFFAQARKMPEELLRDVEEAESDHEQRSRSKSAAGRSARRGSSETVQGDEPEPKRRGTSAR